MSKVFQARFIAALKGALPENISYTLTHELYEKKWVVYAKRPFNGPQSVIEYLGRYTHKIAISNHRIKNISEDKVTFRYKDYRQSAKTKEMTLESLEFIRRFAMHILPKGYVRSRHYSILSSTAKARCALVIKLQLPELPPVKNVMPEREILNPRQCPCCKKETMRTILRFKRREPPENRMQLAKNILKCLR